METLAFLQTSWYVIVGILLAGYAILDGFDLGAGSLLPLPGQRRRGKACRNSIPSGRSGTERGLADHRRSGPVRRFPARVREPYSAGSTCAHARVVRAHFPRGFDGVLGTMTKNGAAVERRVHRREPPAVAPVRFVALGNVIVRRSARRVNDFTGNFFTLLRPYPLAIGCSVFRRCSCRV